MSEATDRRRFEAACDHFEAAWRAGRRPDIAEAIAGFEGEERRPLLRELVCLDIDYRRKAGEDVTAEAYLRRFPELEPAGLGASSADATRTAPRKGEGEGPAPRAVGGYEILGEIARGGMGVVYRARQPGLGRLVALKMILPGQLVTAEAVRRFRTEAENVARLAHESIVPIYEVGEYEGQPFFTMKLIEGGSLDWHVERLLGDPRASASLMATVARAVHHAHQHGLIHRDLKPSNILLDEVGRPHVTDFGLAKRLEASIDLTRSNAIVGTPCYMAPEQAAGQQNVTMAADVYGLGAILYELLCGGPPFKAETPLETLRQVLQDDPEPPSRRRGGVPRDLEVIALKCLAKEPERRYGGTLELAEDLERWLAGEAITARPTGALERGVRWVRRHPALAALIVVSFLGSLALVGALVAGSYNARLAKANAKLEEALETAERERAEADRQRARAVEAERLTRQHAYVSQMAAVQQAHKEKQGGRVLQLLRSLIPEREDIEDLRGWEWHHLWHLYNGEQARLGGHAGGVTGVTFRPGGGLLASSSTDGTVRIWETTRNVEAACCRGHEGQVNAVAFSLRGDRLVTAGEDRTVRVWDSVTGKQLLSIAGHPGPVTCLALSPDGSRIISGSQALVQSWDTLTGGRHWTASVKYPLADLACSPDGARVVAASQDSLAGNGAVLGVCVLLDASTGKSVKELEGSQPGRSSVAYSPDGKLLCVAEYTRRPNGFTGTIALRDASTGRVTAVLTGHASLVTRLAFSPDGAMLASASLDRTIRIWDVAKAVELYCLHEEAGATSVAWSQDGQRLASGSDGRTVKLWPMPKPPVRKVFQAKARINHVAFSPDGSSLAVSSPDGAVVLAIPGGVERFRREGGTHLRAHWGPDSDTLHAGDLVSISKKRLPHPHPLSGPLKHFTKGVGAAFHPRRGFLAEVAHGSVEVWDTATGKRLSSVMKPARPAFQLAVAAHPTEPWIAIGGMDDRVTSPGFVDVHDATSGRLVRSLGGFREHAVQVTFSPDGTKLAAAICQPRNTAKLTLHAEVRVWETAGWQEIRTFRGHLGPVWSLDFSPDGRRLVSAGAIISGGPGEWIVWDIRTGLEVYRHEDGKAGAIAAAFSPCGRWLATGDCRGEVLIRDGSPRR